MDIFGLKEYVSLALQDSAVAVYDSRRTVEPVWFHEMKLKDPIISLANINENKCFVGSSQKEVYEVTPTGK